MMSDAAEPNLFAGKTKATRNLFRMASMLGQVGLNLRLPCWALGFVKDFSA
jgi:hypothetical protein